MEYTVDPDWPQDEAFNNKYGPRNIIHSYATDTDQNVVDERFGPVGKQRIEDDGPAPPSRQETLDDEVTAHTLDFINRAVDKETPFFVWMAPARAHVWTYLSPKYKAQLGNGKGLQDIIMKELDDNVGKVLAELDKLGIADNTIVVFTSDNGPETMTWPDGGTTPFHGEKGTTWEGGFRVPAIARWPGHFPEGKVYNGIFDGMDWMPTLKATRCTWMATISCRFSRVNRKVTGMRFSITRAQRCRPCAIATGRPILSFRIMAGEAQGMS
jgi:arylsulfatase A-like enzyme